MRLRFLKGNWKFGKYKLQTLNDFGTEREWEDVPMVELPALDQVQGILKGEDWPMSSTTAAADAAANAAAADAKKEILIKIINYGMQLLEGSK